MSKTGKGPIYQRGEAEFIEQVQAASVSGETYEEVAARAYRELLPVLVRWLNSEHQRGTHDDSVLAVMPTILMSQLATVALNKFPDPKVAAEFIDRLKPVFNKEWKRVCKMVREQKGQAG